jgi:DNA repair protein RadC
MFIGPNNATTISVREIFEEVLAHNGSAMIAVHNHPSGEALPSLDDEIATSHLMEAGEVMGIDVIDHLIIGAHQYYSMKAETLYNAHDK